MPRYPATKLSSTKIIMYHCTFFNMAQQPAVGQGLLIIEDSWSHSDIPHAVGLLWTSDEPDAETSTWQNTKLTTDISYPRRESNPQYQQLSGRRPTP